MPTSSKSRKPRRHQAVYYLTNTDPPLALPALIRRVHANGTCDLSVFYNENETGPHPFNNVPFGALPGCWRWADERN